MSLTKSELQKLLSFSQEIIQQSGDLVKKTRAKIIKYKDEQDVATTADIKSETLILNAIKQKFPNHSIYSEEAGKEDKNSDFRWVIDPVDGTKEYLRGLPFYTSMLALEYKKQLIIACNYNPSTKELFSAAHGLGSFKNSKKIKVSSQKEFEKCVVYGYIPTNSENSFDIKKSWRAMQQISTQAYRFRTFAGVSLGLCWLAQGGFEAYINLSNPMKWYDIAPGLLIAREAGAIVTDKKGVEIKNRVDSLVVANNNITHKKLITIITT